MVVLSSPFKDERQAPIFQPQDLTLTLILKQGEKDFGFTFRKIEVEEENRSDYGTRFSAANVSENGCVLVKRKYFLVDSICPISSASRSGLHIGDNILEVNKESVRGRTYKGLKFALNQAFYTGQVELKISKINPVKGLLEDLVITSPSDDCTSYSNRFDSSTRTSSPLSQDMVNCSPVITPNSDSKIDDQSTTLYNETSYTVNHKSFTNSKEIKRSERSVNSSDNSSKDTDKIKSREEKDNKSRPRNKKSVLLRAKIYEDERAKERNQLSQKAFAEWKNNKINRKVLRMNETLLKYKSMTSIKNNECDTNDSSRSCCKIGYGSLESLLDKESRTVISDSPEFGIKANGEINKKVKHKEYKNAEKIFCADNCELHRVKSVSSNYVITYGREEYYIKASSIPIDNTYDEKKERCNKVGYRKSLPIQNSSSKHVRPAVQKRTAEKIRIFSKSSENNFVNMRSSQHNGSNFHSAPETNYQRNDTRKGFYGCDRKEKYAHLNGYEKEVDRLKKRFSLPSGLYDKNCYRNQSARSFLEEVKGDGLNITLLQKIEKFREDNERRQNTLSSPMLCELETDVCDHLIVQQAIPISNVTQNQVNLTKVGSVGSNQSSKMELIDDKRNSDSFDIRYKSDEPSTNPVPKIKFLPFLKPYTSNLPSLFKLERMGLSKVHQNFAESPEIYEKAVQMVNQCNDPINLEGTNQAGKEIGKGPEIKSKCGLYRHVSYDSNRDISTKSFPIPDTVKICERVEKCDLADNDSIIMKSRKTTNKSDLSNKVYEYAINKAIEKDCISNPISSVESVESIVIRIDSSKPNELPVKLNSKMQNLISKVESGLDKSIADGTESIKISVGVAEGINKNANIEQDKIEVEDGEDDKDNKNGDDNKVNIDLSKFDETKTTRILMNRDFMETEGTIGKEYGTIAEVKGAHPNKTNQAQDIDATALNNFKIDDKSLICREGDFVRSNKKLSNFIYPVKLIKYNVTARKKSQNTAQCHSCKTSTQNENAIIMVQQLKAVYHLNCFKCCVCNYSAGNRFKNILSSLHSDDLDIDLPPVQICKEYMKCLQCN
ncbi:unnamed protein product [Gordionus sp. m RMFG-2023]|uniref:uncharacterized protein LOC135923240 n=1 Tax=Gordionus sp. m RMFG-2023 TaxID=3053472 RepID=UPI0030DFECD1